MSRVASDQGRFDGVNEAEKKTKKMTMMMKMQEQRDKQEKRSRKRTDFGEVEGKAKKQSKTVWRSFGGGFG